MIHGVISIYKEKGYTSFDVVARLRGILHQKKIGHTGTLDPDAEGVLPVCLGKGTKLCDMLTDTEKTYRAVMLLGRVTDTQDAGGKTLAESPVLCSEEEVRGALMRFVGTYAQVPPMYSALKVNGQKLCDLARAGRTVERRARNVTIAEIVIEEICLPRVIFTVRCSKGTYIRTLCEDVGSLLGCGACMESLLRARVGRFTAGNSLRLNEVEAAVLEGRIRSLVTPIDGMFEEYPPVYVKQEHRRLIENGNFVTDDMLARDPDETMRGRVRLYDEEGAFFAVYAWKPEKERYEPVKMFYEREE